MIDRWVFLVILFALSTLVSGCTPPLYKPYTAYEGPPRPTEEIAVLYCDHRCGMILDPSGAVHDLRIVRPVFFDPIYLEPGDYKMTIPYWFSVNFYSSDYYTGHIPVTFEAGHTYRILQEHRCKVLWWGERTADVWIKDETTDTIVVERLGLRHNCN